MSMYGRQPAKAAPTALESSAGCVGVLLVWLLSALFSVGFFALLVWAVVKVLQLTGVI